MPAPRRQSIHITSQSGSAIGVFLLFGAIPLVLSLGFVYTASTVTACIVIAAICANSLLAWRTYREQLDSMSPAVVLLIVGALWAAITGLVVFEWHWLAFTPAAAVWDALFVLALIIGAWREIGGLLRAFSALTAIVAVAGTIFLPRPAGGEGAFDTANEWKVKVGVSNTEGTPIEAASVLCGTVLKWKQALHTSRAAARLTDAEGTAPEWEFHEDPRLKVVLCEAWKPQTDGNAEFPRKTGAILSIIPKKDYELKIELEEAPHPDRSFVVVDVTGDYARGWYTLAFELWDSVPDESTGRGEGNSHLIQTKSWAELRESGFSVPSTVADRPLYLRYAFEGPSRTPDPDGFGPPYTETRVLRVPTVPPGGRVHMQIRIPDL
jgi:hypothetical protein